MGRPVTLRADVFKRFAEAATVILVPEPVDEDARGERVVGGHNPIGEIKAVRVRFFKFSEMTEDLG